MRQLYPPVPPAEDPEVDLAPADLRETRLAWAYRWPTGDRPMVRANMITSLDGRATLAGRAGGLGNPADQRLLDLLRQLSQVVLVGPGTILAERYTGLGLDWPQTPPPLAVITTRPLDPALPIFTTTRVPPILLTNAATAPALAACAAEVVVVDQPPGPRACPSTETSTAAGSGVGKSTVDPAAALAALADRGLVRVLCEGGPTLLGQLISANLLDELCLTISPVIAGPQEIPVFGPAQGTAGWELRSMFIDHELLFTRYERPR